MLQARDQLQGQQAISEHFEYSFSLASFEKIIKHNFQLVQKLLGQHQRSINQLQLQILASIETKTTPIQTTQQVQPKEKEGSENKSRLERRQKSRQRKKSQKETEAKGENRCRGQGDMQKQSEGITVENKRKQDLVGNQRKVPLTEESLLRTPLMNEAEATVSRSNEISSAIEDKRIFSENEKEVYQSKMFQLFERVRKLEEQELQSARKQNKKFKQFQFSLETCNKSLERAQQSQQLYKDEVEKLRNELTQYKLKKQSKINKLLHSNSLSQSSIGNDNYDYIAEKIQFLLKHVKELLTKKAFEDERDVLQQSVEVLRKKLNDTISQGYLQQSLKNTQIKIYNSIVKYVKSVQHKKAAKDTDQEGEGENELEKMIAQENRELTSKVNQQQEKIKQVGQRMETMQLQLELLRKQRLQTEQQINDQFKVILDDQRAFQAKLSLLEKTDQGMRHDFTQKHVESEGQIIDLQEQLERINSQLKTYNYALSDKNTSPNGKHRDPAENQTSSLLELSSQLQIEKTANDKSIANASAIQQEISLLKKKMSKMSLKIQGVKEDLLGVRKDFSQEVEGVRMYLEKKADWESLKKALSYFDQKTKQTKIVLEHLYNSSMERQEGNGDDSLAVKKGWTCLMCDRDIKNYEGKISQAKFTSMFPIRESPRIGGYYKQQQMSQEYKQVFLNNPINNRSKRIGSLRSNPTNQSKQQLYG